MCGCCLRSFSSRDIFLNIRWILLMCVGTFISPLERDAVTTTVMTTMMQMTFGLYSPSLSLVSFVSCTGFYGRAELILCTTRILIFRHAEVNCARQPKLEWVIEVKLCTWMTRVCTQSGFAICQNCTSTNNHKRGKHKRTKLSHHAYSIFKFTRRI